MIATASRADVRSVFSPVLDLMHDGRVAEALERLDALESRYHHDAVMLQHIGEHLMHAHQNARAVRVYRRACALLTTNAQALYNLATALIAMGDMNEAEALLDRVIALAPHDYDAYHNRSTLRRQTPGRNHVDELEATLKQGGAERGEVQLAYALAKEYEDLGEWDKAFACLKRGADRRKRHLSYAVADDLRAMTEIMRVFDTRYLNDDRAGHDSIAPIFVMGLPRSGTTLVDRIVSSHDTVQSMGEINDFALCLTRLANTAGGGKMNLIAAARQIDPADLGHAYCRSVAGYGLDRVHFIDKTPANYLYAGLIMKALPKARIVHLNRDPMDTGYALYKTLFRMGCPYSYDLGDLGAYMAGHHRLTAHWRGLLPGRIIDIGYEAVVHDTEVQSRALIMALGLDWQDACLDFHSHAGAAATASAAQVRQPVYTTSVGLWQRYDQQLQPLAEALRQNGLTV